MESLIHWMKMNNVKFNPDRIGWKSRNPGSGEFTGLGQDHTHRFKKKSPQL